MNEHDSSLNRSQKKSAHQNDLKRRRKADAEKDTKESAMTLKEHNKIRKIKISLKKSTQG